MRKGSSRRSVVAAAVLASAIVAVLVPSAATTAAPEPSLGVLRAKLADAIAEEKRALELLRKKPPRRQTARNVLERSIERLREIRSSPSLPANVADALDGAIREDENARSWSRSEIFVSGAVPFVEAALQQKSVAMSLLSQPASAQGPQCSDRVDNDGDGTVDARHDSGCTNGKDGTEATPLTCKLGVSGAVVSGSCSGPFAILELTVPANNPFDTGALPTVKHAQACRYATPRKLECVMSDGAANPRHVVNVNFKRTYRTRSGLRVMIRDFAGRGRTWPVTGSQAPSPAPTLRFSLSYTHVGLSHVCASVEATSGALLKLSLEGPNGQAAEGTLQLKKKTTKTATGGFSFRILQFGSYRVTVIAIVGGKSVTKTQTISVTDAPGDSRCSATGAPPP